MTKKERVLIQREDDLDTIDLQLEEAMLQLDGTNQRINELLQSFEPAPTADAQPLDAAEIREKADADQPENKSEGGK